MNAEKNAAPSEAKYGVLPTVPAIVFVFWGSFLYLLASVPAKAEQVSVGKSDFTVEIAFFREGEKEKYKLSRIAHPYSFDLKIIQSSMASLGYQERTIAWSDAKRVFNNSVIQNLAPAIAEKFAQAGSDQRIVFKTFDSSGKTLAEGDVFLTFQGLHWRFTVINRSKRGIDDFSIMGENWRLVERDGQKYWRKTRMDLNNLAQDITNWVILWKVRPDAARVLKAPSPVPATAVKNETPQAADGSDIKKKLRLLEELKQENLIGEEEYQKKREEILRRF